jgi:Family of unknown function (DUF6065)
MRGIRFCDPLTSATANGWWIFPPIGFALMWDGGTEFLWTYDNDQTWYPLTTAQFPDFAKHFSELAPADCKEFAPPFLSASIEPGIVQIWCGWLARTRRGWSSLVRPPVNLPHPQGYECFEGIIETDSWFGPLLMNIRLNKTDRPILIRPEVPMFQVTPIYRDHYSNHVLDNVKLVDDATQWSNQDWDSYRKTVVAPQFLKVRPLGLHAATIRRRRRRATGDNPGDEKL